MTENFIKYEQALALKELGFDEPCLFAFDNCSIPMRCSDLRTNEQKFYGVNYNSSSYTSQPLKQQVFRWFREKHGLYTDLFVDDNKTFGYLISSFIEEGRLDKPILRNYNTYEEAENACIDKLIEIVKK